MGTLALTLISVLPHWNCTRWVTGVAGKENAVERTPCGHCATLALPPQNVDNALGSWTVAWFTTRSDASPVVLLANAPVKLATKSRLATGVHGPMVMSGRSYHVPLTVILNT